DYGWANECADCRGVGYVSRYHG
ncbi:hypothetical protein A2U01_0098173, partial [Trifolium medium]|nr:hypothetical protein [Trifolium medium]